MSERYIRIYSYKESGIFKLLKDMVSVEKGAILLDNEENRKICQVMYRNNSEKSIKSLSVRIHTFDANGVKNKNVQEYEYDGLIAPPGETFGENIPIILEDGNAFGFAIEFISVSFSDGSVKTSAGDKATEVVCEMTAAAPGAAKMGFKVIAIIANIIFTLNILLIDVGGICAVVSEPTRSNFIALISAVGITVITFPFFDKVIFKKKYGILQRILRWIVFPVLIIIIAGYCII